MRTLKELKQKAQDKMKNDKRHTFSNWATHKCTLCGYEQRMYNNSINCRCQNCQRYGMLKIIEKQ